MPDDATRSRAADPQPLRCAGCRHWTIYRDPQWGVPRCLLCLRESYPDWEFAEKLREGAFGG